MDRNGDVLQKELAALTAELGKEAEQLVGRHAHRLQQLVQASLPRHEASTSSSQRWASPVSLAGEGLKVSPSSSHAPRGSLAAAALEAALCVEEVHEDEARQASHPLSVSSPTANGNLHKAASELGCAPPEQPARSKDSSQLIQAGMPEKSQGALGKDERGSFKSKDPAVICPTMSINAGSLRAGSSRKQLAPPPEQQSAVRRKRIRPSKRPSDRASLDIREWVQNREDQIESEAAGEKTLVERLVQSPVFDKIMGALLLLNAFLIGVKTDWLARNTTEDVPFIFSLLDWAFCVAFVTEVVLRLTAEGLHDYFCGREWKWNNFDFFIVAIQVTDEMMQIVQKGDSNAGQEVMDGISFVRIFRLARLVRFMRMVRLLAGLKSIVYLLMASMGSFCWAAVMLMFLMFCVAVYFTEVYSLSAKADPESAEKLEVYWGSVPQSTLSLFMAIFGGFDWKDVLDLFQEVDSGAYFLNTIIISFYIAFTTLVMLNLVTGVFVEGAQRIVKGDRDKELLHLAKNIFAFADQNGNNQLEDDEFVEILESNLMESFCEANNINSGEVEILYNLLKEPGADSVKVTDFVRACKLLQGEARAADVQTVKLMCKQFFEQVESILLEIHETVVDGSKSDLCDKWRVPAKRLSVREPPQKSQEPTVSANLSAPQS